MTFPPHMMAGLLRIGVDQVEKGMEDQNLADVIDGIGGIMLILHDIAGSYKLDLNACYEANLHQGENNDETF